MGDGDFREGDPPSLLGRCAEQLRRAGTRRGFRERECERERLVILDLGI